MTDVNPNGVLRPLEKVAEAIDFEERRTVTVNDLSADQKEVFSAVLNWFRDQQEFANEGILTLGGYAGTGKSTLVSLLLAHMQNQGFSVAVCAFTGKAASVLRRKLSDLPNLNPGKFYVGTIHNLIYRPYIDEWTGELKGFSRAKKIEYDLIIVDEASMVTEDILRDLQLYGIPILAVGDHGQLPPVGSQFSLMKSPKLRLERIHRQAEGNPIIALSVAIREDRGLPLELVDGDSISLVHYTLRSQVEAALSRYFQAPEDADLTAILCGYNKTRIRVNKAIQERVGLSPENPEVCPLSVNDRVICLKNAYFQQCMIANGVRGIVQEVTPDGGHWLDAKIRHEEEGYLLEGNLSKYTINREKGFTEFAQVPFPIGHWDELGLSYDLGYAMTVHKAQGSQFPRVLIFNERFSSDTNENYNRWLYTAVTRAQLSVVLIK